MGKFLFEIHDQPWFPAFLRDQTTDALQFVLDAGHIYAPIAPRLRKALSDTRTNRVIDLCSGAGGPWASLHNSLRAEGTPPVKIFLTDKYPHATEMLNAGMPGPDGIDSYPEPIDATNVPAKLKGFRTMFSSFHHFETTEARAILQDAVDKKDTPSTFYAAVPVVALDLDVSDSRGSVRDVLRWPDVVFALVFLAGTQSAHGRCPLSGVQVEYRRRARRVIPGGDHLFNRPTFFSRSGDSC